MRQAPISYPGVFHHVMKPGREGKDIFHRNRNKIQFTEYLAAALRKLKSMILAYFPMDNHYYLVPGKSIENMSESMMAGSDSNDQGLKI